MRAEPGIGGATPTIVPLSLLGTPPGGGPAGLGGPPGIGGGAPAAGIGGGGAPGIGGPAGAGAAPGAIGGAEPPWPCIISIVPLNFGAAAPLRLKVHFVQF